ncbi:MAG TPA: hypothetical protein VMU93_07220 [Caulobacteraceae bacterium]|nr:hypothetical protein [Caulobacteraceae bacterium]
MTRLRIALVIAAALGLIGLAVGASADPRGALHGWLLGFVFISLAPPGALVLMMIARLTSAPWGEDFGPQLRSMAAAAPWLFVLGLPVAILLAWTYPWATPGGAPAQLRLYLSPGPFLARAVVAIAGWSALAFLVRRGRFGQGVAALGLVFQAIVLCIIPNDWVLSLRPGWTTTDVGMLFLTLEVAFPAAAILLFGPPRPTRSSDDIAGFLIAGVLGLIYMTFVAWLVDWYGDLPDRAGWWLAHLVAGRWTMITAAFAVGALVFASLGFGRRYRLAGGLALAAIAIFSIWLLSPNLGALPWLVAPAGLVFHAAALGLVVTTALGRGLAAHV